MKKFTPFFMFFILMNYYSFASDIITFKANNKQDGSNVKIERVLIKNLTKDKEIITTATSFDLSYFNILEVKDATPAEFNISNVYPNEFTKNVNFTINAVKSCMLAVSVSDVQGKEVIKNSFLVEPGANKFLLNGEAMPAGAYFIYAKCGEQSLSTKIIKVGSGNSSIAEIKFLGNDKIIQGTQSEDTYDFIGSANGFEDDTLYSVTPHDGDQIQFEFVKLPIPVLTLNNIVPIVLKHIVDSDSTTVMAGADCIMLFEPNWKMHILLTDSADVLDVPGTYSIDNNQLTLSIDSAGMNVHTSFSFDVYADTIKMPFKVFSTTKGYSLWENSWMPPEMMAQTIFKSATIGENLNSDDAIQRVYEYINFFKDLRAERVTKSPALLGQKGSTITSVFKAKNGIVINYEGGATVDVELFSWCNKPDPPELTLNSLGTDPRVFLEVKAPGDASSDPKERTALIYAPFRIFKTFAWYNSLAFNLGIGDYAYNGDFLSGSANFNYEEMVPLLQKCGYTVTEYNDQNADIFALINYFKNKSPGFVVINTHGMSNGKLALGQRIGIYDMDPNDPNHKVFLIDANAGWKREWPKLRDKLKSAGYGDLITYDGGTEDQPNTISFFWEDGGVRPNSASCVFCVTPSFWKWLIEKKHTDFSKSLVYIASCSTDATPDLREAINAKAYFAWSSPAPVQLAGAIFQYFCNALKRYSHSSEEAFYNLIRVSTTRQMIYKEDEILNGYIFDQKGKSSYRYLYNNFHGYGFDGTDLFEYKEWGWFDTSKVNLGNIWWLVFAGRWGQDAKGGADGLYHCWDLFWKDGKLPGLADVGCNASTPGSIPNQYEFDYSYYLLTGKRKLNAAIFSIPRWTLRDGDTK
ncbi:MAG: T9SS type A sorting domain-containing protein [FCB group bacterium]|jgi:hypothetical protein